MKLTNSVSLTAMCLGLCTAATLAFGSAASAQEYDRVVVFGDSLSDNGNLPVGSAPPAPYVGGRFSNGPTWVEQLGFGPLGHPGTVTGSVDYAFGGARTDSQASPPGMQVQLSMYSGFGGTYGANNLVTVWGGANDVFQAIPGASVNPNPGGVMTTTGVSAANNIQGIVNSIANAGAGTILVPNLPKLSVTPQFLTSPAAGLADAGANAFNAQLLTNLKAQAALHPNTNIILMDVYAAGLVVTANPTLFGFTNVTQPCFNGVSVCATPSTYFYWDGVHPTTAGHHLLAQLATESIYYGDFGVATSAQGEGALRHRGQTFDKALDHLQMRSFDGAMNGVSASYDRDDVNADARGTMPGVDAQSDSLRFNYDFGVSPSMRGGMMFSASRADTVAGAVSYRHETVSLDAYLGWRSGDFFVNATGGLGADTYRNIQRVTAIAPLVNDASTNGWSGGAKVQAGVWLDMGGMTLSPRAAISASHVDVDGYTERGLIVRQVIESRSIDAIGAEASLRLDAPLGDGFGLYLEGGYRDYLNYEGDPVTVSLAGNTALPLSTEVPEADGGLMLIDAGLKARIGEHVEIGLGYRGRTGDTYESHMGAVTVKYRF
jgi:outer membrane lipase/esterase